MILRRGFSERARQEAEQRLRELEDVRRQRGRLNEAKKTGHWFRCLAQEAERGGRQPHTDLELVEQLAVLEQRIADIEAARE